MCDQRANTAVPVNATAACRRLYSPRYSSQLDPLPDSEIRSRSHFLKLVGVPRGSCPPKPSRSLAPHTPLNVSNFWFRLCELSDESRGFGHFARLLACKEPAVGLLLSALDRVGSSLFDASLRIDLVLIVHACAFHEGVNNKHHLLT